MHYTIGGELYHHGILGMIRGIRNGPPYPLSRQDHSANEKKAKWWKSLDKESKKKKNDEDRVTKNEQKNQNEEDEKKKYEEGKERALKSGSATEVLKYQGDLTNNQLMDAITRIEREGRLKSMSESENKTQTMGDKLDNIFNKIDRARNWAEKGINAYNTTAKIINAISGEDDMPIIGEKHKTKNEKELSDLRVKNQELQNKLIKQNVDLKKQETKKAKELAKQEKLNTKYKKKFGIFDDDDNVAETKKESKKEEKKETKKEEKTEPKKTDSVSKVRDKYKGDDYAQSVITAVVNSDYETASKMAKQIIKDKTINKKKASIYEDALRAVGVTDNTFDLARKELALEEEAEKHRKAAGA